jgi:multiple sugar transport system ATP-binding protein
MEPETPQDARAPTPPLHVSMVRIRLDHVTKSYANGARGAVDVSLEAGSGDWVTLVGPSGSGKTTLLRLVAGLERPTSGTIRFADRDLTGLPPKARDVAMVFQQPAIYPHLSVFENIAFPLRMRGRARASIADEVGLAAAMVGVEGLLRRNPRELSGGEAQRVTLARAIARRPACFLFDEPLASLDAPLRAQLRRELRSLRAALGATVLYVTHDQDEALAMSDRLAVIGDGRLHQIGSPESVYREPADGFVARFFGTPPMNLFRGRLTRVDGRSRFQSEAFGLPWLPWGVSADAPAGADGADLVLGVRPEDLTPTGPQRRDDACLTGRVTYAERWGDGTIVQCVAADGTPFAARCAGPCSHAPGNIAKFAVAVARLHVFAFDPSEPFGAGKRRPQVEEV